MTEPQAYFEWSDAWVFVALTGVVENKPFDLVHVIAYGDVVNRAIFNPKELRQGFRKLITKGMIQVNGPKVVLTKIGVEILNKVKNDGGGLFSLIDNTLKRMNSPGLKLDDVEFSIDRQLDFLTNEAIGEACEKYLKSMQNKI